MLNFTQALIQAYQADLPETETGAMHQTKRNELRRELMDALAQDLALAFEAAAEELELDTGLSCAMTKSGIMALVPHIEWGSIPIDVKLSMSKESDVAIEVAAQEYKEAEEAKRKKEAEKLRKAAERAAMAEKRKG